MRDAKTSFSNQPLAASRWLQGIQLFCTSNERITTRGIQRTLNCSMKAALFSGHPIGEVLVPCTRPDPLGGHGKVVEVQETPIGTAWIGIDIRRSPRN